MPEEETPQSGAPGASDPARTAAELVDKDAEEAETLDAVSRPAKVMRIGSMTKQLLDEASRARLKEIYETSVRELAEGMSGDLRAELDRLALPFDSDVPSEAELRVAQAQLVGWLEGLFHGIQATLFAQQMAARSQLEEMRQRGLPTGRPPEVPGDERRGVYL